jgi:transmembrane sensor
MSSSPEARFPHSPPLSAPKAEATAADWLARRDAGLNDEEEIQFQQWLAADARHATAWREIESTWRAFDGPRHRGEADRMIRELTARRRRRRRRALIGSAAAAVVAMAAIVFVSRSRAPLAIRAMDTVVVSKPERRLLVDGSIVELDAGAQIEVHFSAQRRAVSLLHGEAHFAVAKNPLRPFVVTTTLGEARAVGTAFSVGLSSTAMDVLVTEGAVAVQRSRATMRPPVSISAGSAVAVPAAAAPDAALRVETLAPAEIERRLAWRAPRLHLSNTPLSDVVAAFNREDHVQLTVADSSLAGLRLTGVFRADRAEEFVRLLVANYRVRVEHQGSNVVVLRATP